MGDSAASLPESEAEREQRIKERADEARPNVSMTPGQAQTLCGYGYSLFCKRPGCALGLCKGQHIPSARAAS